MLDILLISILILGFLIGKKIGFIKTVYVFISFFASFIAVKFFTPLMMPVIMKTTYYKDMVLKFSEYFDVEEAVNDVAIAGQNQVIGEIPVLEPFMDKLIENNNIDIYEMLGVETFTDYLANMVSYAITFIGASIIVFICSSLILTVIGFVLKVFSKLPIISTINGLIGGLIGLFNTAIILWVIAIAINVFGFNGLAIEFNAMVNESIFAKVFFDSNIFFEIIEKINTK